jgi:chemotaxis protein CheX
VRDVWAATVGIELHPALRPADDDGAPGGDPGVRVADEVVTGWVAIEGTWEGTVSVRMAPPLAEVLAAAMFGVRPDELTRCEIEDAVGEVANMTGGGVKALLRGPCELSLPAVRTGHAGSPAPGAASLRLVDHHGRAVVVTVQAGGAIPQT